MDLTLLALALSGSTGLWHVGQKGELIVPDGIIEEIPVPSFAYASIQDDGLYVSYTDDSCVDGLKTKGCLNGDNAFALWDTTGQGELLVLRSVNGQPVLGFMDYTDDSFMDYAEDALVACGEGDGIFDTASGAISEVAMFQLRKGGSWDLLAHVQTTGLVYQKIEGSFAGTDATLSCAAYSGGEIVAETQISVRNADRLTSSPQSVTGVLGYRGSWVE